MGGGERGATLVWPSSGSLSGTGSGSAGENGAGGARAWSQGCTGTAASRCTTRTVGPGPCLRSALSSEPRDPEARRPGSRCWNTLRGQSSSVCCRSKTREEARRTSLPSQLRARAEGPGEEPGSLSQLRRRVGTDICTAISSPEVEEGTAMNRLQVAGRGWPRLMEKVLGRSAMISWLREGSDGRGKDGPAERAR